MSNNIRTGINGVGAVGLSRSGGGKSRAGAALSSLASQIAGHIAGTLNLAGEDSGDDNRRGKNFITANDLYEIEALSNELSRGFSANGAESARLTAALHKFAEQSAALLGARPAAYSMEHLAQAISSAVSDNGGPEDMNSALAIIERASQTIEHIK